MDTLDQLAKVVARELKQRRLSPPSDAVLTTIFDTLYFSSLKHEEGRSISCRVAYLNRANPDPDPPERIVKDRWSVTRLEQPVLFTVANLVKLSMAVDPWCSTLALDADETGVVSVWGMIDQGVHWSTYIVRESNEGNEQPGLFHAVIEGIGDIAVYRSNLLLAHLRQSELATRQLDVFGKGPIRTKLQPHIDRLISSVRKRVGDPIYSADPIWDASLAEAWIATLCRVLIGIQRYHHGGAVLLTPTSRTSGLNIKYGLSYSRLASALENYAEQRVLHTHHDNEIHLNYLDPHEELMPVGLFLEEVVSRNELQDCRDEITGCVRYLAALSRVDGLILLQNGLNLKGFGVEITSKKEDFELILARNAEASSTREGDLNHFGTRHRSMMRFCAAYDDSVGFVVSQDGDIRAITKVGEGVVMWDNIRVHFIKEPKTSRSHGKPK